VRSVRGKAQGPGFIYNKPHLNGFSKDKEK
jgi:hypothetical protein